MQQLTLLLDELELQIANKHVTKQSVSKSTVGWQINHCLIVINGVISQIQQSNPDGFKSKFNFKRWLVFTTKHIPRGKANAPKQVNPTVEATAEELTDKLALAKVNCAKLVTLAKNHYFEHPFFGDLNVKNTNRFLELHTFHHLKIIRDLVAS